MSDYDDDHAEGNDEDENDPSTRSFSVFVCNSKQEPVSGAHVSCVYASFFAGVSNEYTDETGHASIDGVPWRAALSFTLYVNGEDFGTQSVEADGEALTAMISD